MEQKDYYSVKAISNSGLKHINPEQGGSPRKYKRYVLDGAQGRDTPSLKNGKLVHLYIEDPRKFIISDITLPSEMMESWVTEVYEGLKEINVIGKTIDFASPVLHSLILEKKGERYSKIKDESKIIAKFIAEGGIYLVSKLSVEGKLVLTKAEKEIVLGCIDSIKNHAKAKQLLLDLPTPGIACHNEFAIYWSDKWKDEEGNEGEINFKALLDRVIVDHGKKTMTLVDFKTTSKPVSKFAESIQDYRYYRQMAFYHFALTQHFEGYFLEDIYFVVTETFGVFETKVYRMSSELLIKGAEEFKDLLERVIYHTSTNQWEHTPEELETKGVIEL